ncbi:MAG: hypothetical protein H6707_18035 [Deltaproteobacteria bacterium]|nr:hypothetical protein [Deltaproteobacteria bacterium]
MLRLRTLHQLARRAEVVVVGEIKRTVDRQEQITLTMVVRKIIETRANLGIKPGQELLIYQGPARSGARGQGAMGHWHAKAFDPGTEYLALLSRDRRRGRRQTFSGMTGSKFVVTGVGGKLWVSVSDWIFGGISVPAEMRVHYKDNSGKFVCHDGRRRHASGDDGRLWFSVDEFQRIIALPEKMLTYSKRRGDLNPEARAGHCAWKRD